MLSSVGKPLIARRARGEVPLLKIVVHGSAWLFAVFRPRLP